MPDGVVSRRQDWWSLGCGACHSSQTDCPLTPSLAMGLLVPSPIRAMSRSDMGQLMPERVVGLLMAQPRGEADEVSVGEGATQGGAHS
jgi:hypothetical protein